MATANAQLRFYDFEPETNTLYEDVIEGLKRTPKSIPPKYFYDEYGSRLFDAICNTPEYYPTRTEMCILNDNLEEICAYLGENCVLIEPGSGNSKKVRLLLDSLEPHTYMPLDISSEYLKNAARNLANDYPNINVTAACVDYTNAIKLPYFPANKRRVAFFPGSSIGNFEPREAAEFLANIADVVHPNGGLLIGIDLKKDTDILHAAYNDREGITAEFNLNVLTHINRELGANFDLKHFRHQAWYNEIQGRIEMHLVSTKSHRVSMMSQTFHFEEGESIHTENSYKYTIEEFQALAGQVGFKAKKTWTDGNQLFSVHYFELDK